MDTIDAHGLSDEEARLVAEFVEFIRQRKKQQTHMQHQETIGEDTGQGPQAVSFAAWPLGVKGTLSERRRKLLKKLKSTCSQNTFAKFTQGQIFSTESWRSSRNTK